MPIRLVVFDLDGTLADTMEDIAESMDAMLRAEGLATPERSAYAQIVGDGARVAVQRATAGAVNDEAEIDRLTEAYLEEYRARGPRSARLYPGVAELLASLEGRVEMAVLTNKPHDLAQVTIEAVAASTRFARIEGVRVGGVRKPDPSVLIDIVESCGVQRAEVVMVGDTNTDMRTGEAAGVATIGVTWGFRDEAELAANGATWIARTPADVLESLGL